MVNLGTLFGVITVLFLSVSSHAKSCEFEGDAAKPHAVFLIHGLTGNSETFGDLPSLLDKVYVKTCKKNLRVHNIEYFTKPKEAGGVFNFHRVSTMHPYDFAKVAYAEMKSFLLKQKAIDKINGVPANLQFSNDTPYSLIVHSQGGITAMSILQSCIISALGKSEDDEQRCDWSEVQRKFDSLKGEDGKEHERWGEKAFTEDTYTDAKGVEHSIKITPEEMYASPTSNVKQMISLGTPFWGSPTANRSVILESAFERIVSSITKLLKESYPREQIARLAVGGRGTTFQRIFMLNRPKDMDTWADNPEWKGLFDGQLETYNASGILPLWDKDFRKENLKGNKQKAMGNIINFFTNPRYYENDVIVGNPEARADFVYYVQNPKKGGPSLRGKTQMAEHFYPFNMAHVPLFGGNVMGIAKMTEANASQHPTWLVVRRAMNKLFQVDESVKMEGLLAAPSFSTEFTQEEKDAHFVDVLNNFTSEVKLVTPTGYHRPIVLERKMVKVLPPKGSDIFDEPTLASSLFVRTSGKNPDGLKIRHHYGESFYHIGSVKDQYAFKPKIHDVNDINSAIEGRLVPGYPINYEFDVPGFEKLSFTQGVIPSFNSYAEVFLNTYIPDNLSGIEDKSKTVASIIIKNKKLTKNIAVRELYLDKNDQLKVRTFDYDEYTKTYDHEIGICHVGMSAYKTPERFRYQAKLEDGSNKMVLNKIRFDDASFVEWAKTWKEKAQNQLGLYTSLNSKVSVYNNDGGLTENTKTIGAVEKSKDGISKSDLGPDIKILRDSFFALAKRQGREMTKMQFTHPVSVKPRKALEIIGRVSRAPKIGGQAYYDSRSGVAQPCTLGQKDRFPEACSIEAVDRYLVTSPEIRLQDGISDFDHIGSKLITDASGNQYPAGVRWMNAVDVDIFRPDQKISYGTLVNPDGMYQNTIASDIERRGGTGGDNCIKDKYFEIGRYNYPMYYINGELKNKY